MAIGYSTDVRNDRLTVVAEAIDAGGAAGKLNIYTGTQPSASGGALSDNTLLVQILFSSPPQASVAGGVLILDTIAQVVAINTGTATWARATDSDGVFVFDSTVSAAGGGGDLILNTTSITTGVPVEVLTGTLTEGNE